MRTDEATLLDVLIDAFEKNEAIYGFHFRTLPLQDEATAIVRYHVLADEPGAGRPSRGKRSRAPIAAALRGTISRSARWLEV